MLIIQKLIIVSNDWQLRQLAIRAPTSFSSVIIILCFVSCSQQQFAYNNLNSYMIFAWQLFLEMGDFSKCQPVDTDW